jgi:hypothetical protein
MANLWRQADMVHAIARIFDVVLPLALLASVRCRVPRAPWLATAGIDIGARVGAGW